MLSSWGTHSFTEQLCISSFLPLFSLMNKLTRKQTCTQYGEHVGKHLHIWAFRRCRINITVLWSNRFSLSVSLLLAQPCSTFVHSIMQIFNGFPKISFSALRHHLFNEISRCCAVMSSCIAKDFPLLLTSISFFHF